MSTSNDGFVSLRRESELGGNASTRMMKRAVIWNRLSRAVVFPKPANSNSNSNKGLD